MALVLNLLAVLACLIEGTSLEIYRRNCTRESTFKLFVKDSRLDANVISTKSYDSLSRCALICQQAADCRSFNFHPAREKCEVLSQSVQEAGSSKILSSDGWRHYHPLPMKVSPIKKSAGILHGQNFA